MKGRAELKALFRVIHALAALGLLALAAALTFSIPARAQAVDPVAPSSVMAMPDMNSTLGQAVSVCTDPMTDGATKRETIAAYGWQSLDVGEVDFASLAGAHIGSILGQDAPVDVLLDLRSQLETNFRDVAASGGLTLWGQEGAILALSIDLSEAGEALSCYFAGPPGGGIEGFWDPNVDLVPMAQSGSVGTIFTGSAFNARNEITYDEYQLLLVVAEGLTPLTESFRYERVQQP